MTVHYQTFARFVEFFGKEGDIDIIPGATIHSILEQLSGDDEKKRSLLFDDSGAIRRYVIILKNKERILNEERDSIVQDGDEIIIYPPVSGG